MKHLPSLVVLAALAWGSASVAYAADGAAAPPPPAQPAAPSAYAVVDATPGDPCCARCPRWTVSLGAWFYGADGTVAAGGHTVDVNSDWIDIFDNLDLIEFAFDGRVRLATNKWRFTVGLDGATLGDSVQFREGGATADVTLDLWTAYATVGYVFAGGRTDCSPCAGTWCLDAYAGVRYYSVGVDIAATPGAIGALPGTTAVSRTEDWIDPIVGLHLDVTWPKWYVVVEGDIGGFGVGSDFSWNLMGTVGYRFNCTFSVFLGWRVLDTDREDGDFVFDVTQSGPLAGFAITF